MVCENILHIHLSLWPLLKRYLPALTPIYIFVALRAAAFAPLVEGVGGAECCGVRLEKTKSPLKPPQTQYTNNIEQNSKRRVKHLSKTANEEAVKQNDRNSSRTTEEVAAKIEQQKKQCSPTTERIATE